MIAAQLGRPGRALEVLGKAVDAGFFVAPALARDPLIEPLRSDHGFADLLARAEKGRAAALVAFREAGGERLLGASTASS